jgi:hypothetical protein
MNNQHIADKFFYAALSENSLELNKSEVHEVAGIIVEHMVMKERLQAAWAAFTSPDRHEKRASNAIKELGFSEGKRRSRINHNAVFHEYLNLILGGIDWDTFQQIPAIPKQEAVQAIQKKYELASYESAYKFIQRAIKDQGQEGQGLLPSNWPVYD